jgi:hypothetical protein
VTATREQWLDNLVNVTFTFMPEVRSDDDLEDESEALLEKLDEDLKLEKDRLIMQCEFAAQLK